MTAEKDDTGQRAGSVAVSRSGAIAFLGPVRHSWIRFPSILNSAPREDVDRQARTSVRYGLSGESGGITTFRVEARCGSTLTWGIRGIPRFGAPTCASVPLLVAETTSVRTGSTIPHVISEV